MQTHPQSNHRYKLDNEVFSVEIEPADQKHYQASHEIAVLGALTLARVSTNGAVISRKNEDYAELGHKRFSFLYIEDGDMVLSHRLGTSLMKTGDFTLMDNSHQRKMFVYERVVLFIVSVPYEALQRYLPVPEVVEAQIMTAPQPGQESAQVIFSPLLNMWDQLRRGSLREFAPAISERLLTSLAKLYSSQFPGLGTTAVRRVVEAKQIIEAQLSSPDLSVESIAASMRVSSRYLRALFRDSEKLSHYILRRRLEESANLLRNAAQQFTSITTIAFRCGFNSAAHFSRVFHKHFGVTPSGFRRRQLVADASAAPATRALPAPPVE
ncbi:MAG: helix-turn-helix domain-containing protein [Pseudohongiellaceae bacterium]